MCREEVEENDRLEDRGRFEDQIHDISSTVTRMVDQVASLITQNNKLPEKDR